MGLKEHNLPVCDQCGEAWLPSPGPARQDIRAYDARERAKGMKGKPVRCGKCKSTKWDVNYREKAQDVVQAQPEVPEVSPADVVATVCGLGENPSKATLRSLGALAAAAAPARLCRHQRLKCKVCG